MKNILKLDCEYGDVLEVSPNYSENDEDDWSNSIGKKDPIFIDIIESGSCGEEACVALTLEQATELRDFLSEKIDYLTLKQ